MNELLREVALEAGAPVAVLDELWFNIFCMKFADTIITMVEEEAQ